MTNQTNCIFEFSKELDAGFLNELFGEDLYYAITVFEGFLQELPDCFRDMQSAIAANDVTALKAAAHKGKTLFAYAGLTKISVQLQSLEAACLYKKNTKEAEPFFQELLKQKTAIEALITEEIKRLEIFYAK